LEAIAAVRFQDCRRRKVFFFFRLRLRPHLCVVIVKT
jgi:hypothetical protein